MAELPGRTSRDAMFLAYYSFGNGYYIQGSGRRRFGDELLVRDGAISASTWRTTMALKPMISTF